MTRQLPISRHKVSDGEIIMVRLSCVVRSDTRALRYNQAETAALIGTCTGWLHARSDDAPSLSSISIPGTDVRIDPGSLGELVLDYQARLAFTAGSPLATSDGELVLPAQPDLDDYVATGDIWDDEYTLSAIQLADKPNTCAFSISVPDPHHRDPGDWAFTYDRHGLAHLASDLEGALAGSAGDLAWPGPDGAIIVSRQKLDARCRIPRLAAATLADWILRRLARRHS